MPDDESYRSWRINVPAASAWQRPDTGRHEWYRITARSAVNTEVMLFDEVGYWGITGQDFITDLQAITTPNLTLRINSPGGEVYDGIAIYHALKRHPATVAVYVEGLAASIASVIAMAGDTVVMQPQTRMMIHDAAGVCAGTAEDMAELGRLLDGVSADIAAIYAQRAGGTPAGWRSQMLAETWFTADEAVAAGLADEVAGQDTPPVPEARAARAVAAWDPEVFRSGVRSAVAGSEREAPVRAWEHAAAGAFGRGRSFPVDEVRAAIHDAAVSAASEDRADAAEVFPVAEFRAGIVAAMAARR